MKRIIMTLLFVVSITNVYTQTPIKKQQSQIVWVQGIPTYPEDTYITELINKIGIDNLSKPKKDITNSEAKICREIGITLNKKEMYDAADWYLERSKSRVEVVSLEPEVVFENPKDEVVEIPLDVANSLVKDKEFLNNLPKSYDNVSPSDMKKLANEIGSKLQELIEEKERLIKSGVSQEIIIEKESTIKTLDKEKSIIGLNVENVDLKVETKDLKIETKTLKSYLIWSLIGVTLLVLFIVALLQRKTIKVQDVEIENQLEDIDKKNTYLDYAARIIRHDMHSGINTYIPRGMTSLSKRLTPEDITRLKIEAPLKMIKEGLTHTQKVYNRVYEFTNLVKRNVVLDKQELNISETLNKFISVTSYSNQVEIGELPTLNVNDVLFCNAIDNLIRNGLKYNSNEEKKVQIYYEGDTIIVQDNGNGMTKSEFNNEIKRFLKKEEDNESGLGLKITKTILEEHGFSIDCDKNDIGTKIEIKIK
jgi:signal transduction histidine kinase